MIVDSGKDPNGAGEMKQILANEGCQAPCVNSGALLLSLRSCNPRLSAGLKALNYSAPHVSSVGLCAHSSHASSMALHG